MSWKENKHILSLLYFRTKLSFCFVDSSVLPDWQFVISLMSLVIFKECGGFLTQLNRMLKVHLVIHSKPFLQNYIRAYLWGHSPLNIFRLTMTLLYVTLQVVHETAHFNQHLSQLTYPCRTRSPHYQINQEIDSCWLQIQNQGKNILCFPFV